MKQSGPERAAVRERSSFLAELSERSPADPTGPRFIIEDIYPSVDGGRYPVKRIAGEIVDVWADIFREGHDVLMASLLWRHEIDTDWRRVAMTAHGNDRWHAGFTPPTPGNYLFAIEAWTDQFATWRKEFAIRKDSGEDLTLPVREGLELLSQLRPKDRKARAVIDDFTRRYAAGGNLTLLLDDALTAAMERTETRPDLTRSQSIPLLAERERARAGAWYEMVPRSQGTVPGRHGTFNDCIARIPEVAALGFDVLYLTPIHPVGRTNRKGKNNSLNAGASDPGSFYAIGNESGGHDAIEPQLGTLKDFRRLVATCHAHNMEVALDFAVQCSLDHPWLREHPEWFSFRPDGTIRFAENPPKKYEDIVNPNFNGDHRIVLWGAFRKVLLFWAEQGVRIFRVDNPHTKPFPFWEWLLHEVRALYPDVIFLSEAFTRPKVMKALAKLGFSQSYTYFTWRTGKEELQDYVSEISAYPEREYFRPNFFVTTPDILPIQLQTGEPWMFKCRAALAATLSSSYGIYNGFELLEHEPMPGREEYLNSEKYEIKTRDWNRPGNIKNYLARLNTIRRENSALQQTADIRFLQVDSESVIGFVKESPRDGNAIACTIALAGNPQDFWLHFGDNQIGGRPVRAIENLSTGERRLIEWGGTRLRIQPSDDPALLFRCLS